MNDPLNPWEKTDRMPPAGDFDPDSPGLTGTLNTVGGGLGAGGHGDALLSPETAEREAADAEEAAAGGVGDTGSDDEPDADDR